MRTRRVAILAVSALLAACGATKAPRGTHVAVPAVASAGAPSSDARRNFVELVARADELERRGVLDMAAAALSDAYRLGQDPELLSKAARLYAEAWDAASAKLALDELARIPGYAVRAEAARRGLVEVDHEHLTAERQAGIRAALTAAWDQVAAGDSTAALETLRLASELARSLDINRALGALHWMRGEKREAQIWWARGRPKFGWMPESYLVVRAIPELAVAPRNFAFAPEWDDFAWDQPRPSTMLVFASASGELYGYHPAWGCLEDLWGDLRTPADMDDDGDLSLVRTPLASLVMPDAAAPSGISDVAARAVSADDSTLALVTLSNDLWVFSRKQDPRFAALVFHGPLRGRPLDARCPWPGAPLVHVKRGNIARLYLASGDVPVPPRGGRTKDTGAPELARGRILEIDLRGRVLRDWPVHSDLPTHLVATRDGRFLATASGTNVALWDLGSLETVYQASVDANVEDLAFHPSDAALEVTTRTGVTRIDWKKRTPPSTTALADVVHRVHSLDGRYTATALYGAERITVEGIDPKTAHEIRGAGPAEVALSSDGKRLLVAGSALWEFRLDSFGAARLADGLARAPAFSPSGARTAACIEGKLAVFDTSRARRDLPIALPSCPDQVEFVNDDTVVLTQQGIARRIQVGSGRLVSTENAESVFRIHDGEVLLGRTGVTHTLAARGGRQSHPGTALGTNLERTAYVVGDEAAHTIVVYDAEDRELGRTEGQNIPERLTLSNDGRFVLGAAAGAHPTMAILDVSTGKWSDGHDDHQSVKSLALSNGFAITAGSAGVMLWDATQEGSRGSLNLLANGEWFTISKRGDHTAIDGTPDAIDHAVKVFGGFGHVGEIWEWLRRPGSLADQLMRRPPQQDGVARSGP